MKVERMTDLGGGLRIIVTAEASDLAAIGNAMLQEAVMAGGRELAKVLLEQKAQEMVASIPVGAVVNRAVANAVQQIGDAAASQRATHTKRQEDY